MKTKMTTEVKDAGSLFRALAWRDMARYYLDGITPRPYRYDVMLQCVLEAEFGAADCFIEDRVQIREHARAFIYVAVNLIEHRDLGNAVTCKYPDIADFIKDWVANNFTQGKTFS